MDKNLDCDAEEVARELGFESVLQLNIVCDVIITTINVIEKEEKNPDKKD
jgi:hypothetical protein